MAFHTWILFCGFTLISVLTPGPAVLLSVTNSLRRGVRASLFSSFGNIIGLFLVSGTAVLGLGAILKTSAFLFGVFKICGAVYLIYLGVRQWRAVPQTQDLAATPVIQEAYGPGRHLCQGVLVALSNPKAVLFFTALLPQFMDVSHPVLPQFLILTATFMAFSFLALMAYAWGANSFKTQISGGRGQTWLNRISGTVFIGFGIGLLGLKNRTA